jgi:lauroyl/myristoyl acyltransferase
MLEKEVLQYPEQYLWMHDLWNTKQRAAKLVR